ncbi:MAG: pyrroline-5-carboxylate reductase [Emergencia sp.]
MLTVNNADIGFIGFGNMASAIAQGFLKSGEVKGSQIFACARDYEKLCARTDGLGISPCESATEVVNNSDIIFVAVKPYQVESVLAPLRESLEDKIIISVAVNVTCSDYERIIPGTAHISTLPNTPVSVCQGIFICEETHTLNEDQKSLVSSLLSLISMVKWVSPEYLGIAGTISGCGPALTSMFIEALADAAVKHGLPRQLSYELAGQMVAGTGALLVESGEHPAVMKDQVCSPGGTTIRGVASLEKSGFRGAVIKAIDKIQD